MKKYIIVCSILHSIASLQAARTTPSKQPKTESTQLKVIQNPKEGRVSHGFKKNRHKSRAEKRLSLHESLTWPSAICEGNIEGYDAILAARKVYNSGNSTCNVFTKKGENELHFLAIHGKDEKIWSVLKKYVGEIPEHAKKRKDVEGHTPLDYALLHNNSVAIKHLS